MEQDETLEAGDGCLPPPSQSLGVGGPETLGHKQEPNLVPFWAWVPEMAEEVLGGARPGLS